MNSKKPTLLDNYEVMASGIITNYDFLTVLRLYQPIIGVGATSLYLTLKSELEGEKTIMTPSRTFDRLTSLLQTTLDDLNRYARKLEAIGLIKTYMKENAKNKSYIFELYTPLTPVEFFNHDVLSLLFKNVMGELEYERSLVYLTKYEKINPRYDNISATFSEVFGKQNFDEYKYEDKHVNAMGKNKAEINFDFDFELLEKYLKDYQISKRILTSEVRKEIALLSSAYHIGVYDMCNNICASLSATRESIDLNILNRKCKDHVSVSKVEVPTKKKEEAHLSGNESLDEKLKIMNSKTPYEYLKLKYNNKNPVNSDIAVVKKLIEATNLPSPVINVILDYGLIQNNNRLVYKYLEMIGGSLMREGILDAYDAMMFINKSSKKKKEVSKVTQTGNKTTSSVDIDIEDDIRRLREMKEKAKKKGN